MLQVQIKARGNQSIECARLIASIFVVFIHCSFPGKFGATVAVLGYFAVPMFFAISGYYSYRINGEKILSRMKQIFRLYLTAEFVYLVWHIFRTEWKGGSTVSYLITAIPEVDEVAKWLFMNIPPYVGHLWYLLAMVTCYMVLWVYVRFFGEKTVNYRPLYLVSACLLADHLTVGILAAETVASTNFFWYRTALLLGIPMFSLGIFIHEYQEILYENFHMTTSRLVLLIAAGAILTVIQWSGSVETGSIGFGTIIETIALMLFLIAHPSIAKPESVPGKLTAQFGFLSTTVYIIHLMVMEIYKLMLYVPMEAALGAVAESWLRPIIVLALSFVTAVLCAGVRCLWQRRK